MSQFVVRLGFGLFWLPGLGSFLSESVVLLGQGSRCECVPTLVAPDSSGLPPQSCMSSWWESPGLLLLGYEGALPGCWAPFMTIPTSEASSTFILCKFCASLASMFFFYVSHEIFHCVYYDTTFKTYVLMFL